MTKVHNWFAWWYFYLASKCVKFPSLRDGLIGIALMHAKKVGPGLYDYFKTSVEEENAGYPDITTIKEED